MPFLFMLFNPEQEIGVTINEEFRLTIDKHNFLSGHLFWEE